MKILLIEPYGEMNRVRKLVPVGLPCLAAVLLEEGHDVQGFNSNNVDLTADQCTEEIARIVEEGDFDVVGVGGLCMSFPFVKKIFARLRQIKDRPVLVSGGNMFTSEPEFCMEQFGVDYGIFGEGEVPFSQLLDALTHGTEITATKGIFYREGDEIKSTGIPGAIVKELDTLPFPAYELFYDAEDIGSQARVSVYTSRSCPFSCTFCYHPLGSRYRRRSVENVLKEIQFLHERYGTDDYYIADELFLFDKEWIFEFCDALEKQGILHDWVCQTRASHVDPHVLKRLKEAGCRHVRVGIESGSDTVLRSMNKKTTREMNKQAVENIRATGLTMDGGVIMGDFAETRETMQETVEFMKEVDLVANQGIIFVTPLPGSKIWERCLEEGLITDKLEYLEGLAKPFKLRTNMTKLSDNELLGLQEWAAKETFAHLTIKRRGIVDEVIETDDSISRVKLRCPTCGHVHRYGARQFSLKMVQDCDGCKKPLYIHPMDMPHMRTQAKRFIETVESLDPDGPEDILVTPSCLDFIRLDALAPIPQKRIKAFLDQSGPKTAFDYFEKPVISRTQENAAKTGATKLFIVSAEYCAPIYRELSKWDIPGLEIIPLYEK